VELELVEQHLRDVYNADTRVRKAELSRSDRLGARLAQGPPSSALAHLDIDRQGFAWLPEDDVVNRFPGDVDPVKARVMHLQQP
jgi:hypothetical protein